MKDREARERLARYDSALTSRSNEIADLYRKVAGITERTEKLKEKFRERIARLESRDQKLAELENRIYTLEQAALPECPTCHTRLENVSQEEFRAMLETLPRTGHGHKK